MILDEETLELVQMVREFVDNEIIPNVGEIERTGGSPDAILDMACEMGLNTLCLPEEYGDPAGRGRAGELHRQAV